jgi:hypothetical protein
MGGVASGNARRGNMVGGTTPTATAGGAGVVGSPGAVAPISKGGGGGGAARGGRGGGSGSAAGGASNVRGLSKEFKADNPQPMPIYNSPAQLEAARRKRMEIMARSGRTSTNLTGNPGTRSYQNSFLGNV